MLKIEYVDSGNVLEATAVVAALVGIYGNGITSHLGGLSVTHKVGEISINVVGGPEAVTKYTESTKAPDGWPTPADPAQVFGAPKTEEPDPAQVFGGVAPVDAPAAAVGPLDKDGIPWDERIHSGEKGQKQDGTWKRRRNTDDAVYNTVYAELKAKHATPPPATNEHVASGATPFPAAPPPPPANTPAPGAVASTLAGAVDILAMPATNFPEVMAKITKAQLAKLVTPDEIAAFLLAAEATEPKVIQLMKQPGILPAFVAMLDDHLSSAV